MNKASSDAIDLVMMPLNDALRIARSGGHNCFAERDVIDVAKRSLAEAWLAKHVATPCPNLTDDDFNERIAALEDAFQDGLGDLVAHSIAIAKPSKVMRAYSDGIQAPLKLLSSWRVRGESGMLPHQLTAEMSAALSQFAGRSREGLTNTLAAFIILALDGNVCDPAAWDVVHDMKMWGKWSV